MMQYSVRLTQLILAEERWFWSPRDRGTGLHNRIAGSHSNELRRAVTRSVTRWPRIHLESSSGMELTRYSLARSLPFGTTSSTLPWSVVIWLDLGELTSSERVVNFMPEYPIILLAILTIFGTV